MFRNPEITWQSLATFSRSMSQMLEAGVEIRKSLKTSARQAGDRRLPESVEVMVRDIAAGSTLTDAIGKQGNRFPPLFRDLVNVGELTGASPDVFAALARYYDSRLKQVRDLRSAIAWPMFQLFAAIMIIAVLILILGLLPSQANGQPLDVLGLGLLGPKGAAIWLAFCFGTMAGIFVLWKQASRNLATQMVLHPLFMSIPVVGGCMKAFAISRFSWCFALAQQAGMSIRPSLQCSLKATANGAFIMAEPRIWEELNSGESLADSLASSRLFPLVFLQFVETAETSGTVPEQLDRLSHFFEDDANRAMQRLTRIFSVAVWLFVAGIVIFFIFRLFLFYIGTLNDALKSV